MKWVLTAAHCVSGRSSSAITVSMGCRTIIPLDCVIENMAVDFIKQSPFYNPGNM